MPVLISQHTIACHFRNARPGVEVSKNHPRIFGFTYAPHHTFAYATKSHKYSEFRTLIESSSDPVPVFSINYSGRLMKDPAMATLLQRRKLEADKQRLRLRVKKEKLTPTQISKNMIEYIELAETDPDPLIGTEFDWRFMGGNLEVLKNEFDDVLAQPSMCSDYDIRLIERKAAFDYVDLPFNPKEFNKNYAYEILTSKDFIGVRRKNKFSLAKAGEIGHDSLIKTPLEFKCFADIAGCNLRQHDLIYIDVNHNLNRVNLGSSFLINAMVKLPSLDRKHQLPVSVNSFDRNAVTYTNLKQLNLADFRAKEVGTLFNEENFVMKCEELSYHTRSFRKNILYLASSHTLYGMDRRMPKRVLMHWNHQMVMQPTMMKTAELNTEEIICLSSNKPGDLRVFTCTHPPEARGMSWLPYKPQTIAESYKKLRGNGELLLSEMIKHRVDLSVTGIAMSTVKGRKNAKIELFVQNSIGDIFKTNLYPKCSYARRIKEQADVSGYFHEWDDATKVNRNALDFASTKELLNHGELRFTDIVNLKGLASVLRCERLQRNGDETDYGEMKTKMIPRWRVDLEEAKEHKDVLAKCILDEWDLEIEDSQPQAFAEALLATQNLKQSGVDKVSWWLDTASIVAEEMDVEELLAHPVSLLPETQQSEAKKPRKPSQRIKGF